MFLARLILLSSLLVFCGVNVAQQVDESDYKAMMAAIREVKLQHQEQWLKNPEVVSVGIGLNAGQKPAIIIGVKRLTPALKQEFPTEVEGYPVELQAVGSLKAQ